MGGLLASLFMGHGLGTGILSWLLIGLAIFVGWRLISRLRSPNRSFSAHSAFQSMKTPEPAVSAQTYSPHETPEPTTSSSAAHENVSDFDEETFLRGAKTVFIRLQTAYDNKNLADIREFTMPQIFAEIQMQLQERGTESNQTDVITIDAALLDLNIESDNMTASVRFSGLIREQQEKNPENIREIWHFIKDKWSTNWLVAGIQQEA